MIIGINLNHDYAYCKIDGNEIFLNEIERISRIRHHDNNEVYTLALLDNFSSNDLKKIEAIYLNSPKMREIIKRKGDMSSNKRSYRYLGDYVSKNNTTGRSFGKLLVEDIEIPAAWVSHYHAHAASTFWASPFKYADIICIDGGGDYGEGASFTGNKTNISLAKRFEKLQIGSSYHYFSHQVYEVKKGFYESKVMAMASFGEKELSHNSYLNRNGGLNDIEPQKIISVHDIAEFQYQFELGVMDTIRQNASGNEFLCCAGGCFLNVNLNTAIADSNIYKEIYIPPYTGDMGTALGCALFAHLDTKKSLPSKYKLNTAFLGTELKVDIGELISIVKQEGDVPLDKDLYI